MMKSALLMTWLFAALLVVSGCSQTVPASECDGWRKLTPAPATRAFIISQDRPFAQEVAGHNQFGAKRGCWK
jgi:hypothetical protein